MEVTRRPDGLPDCVSDASLSGSAFSPALVLLVTAVCAACKGVFARVAQRDVCLTGRRALQKLCVTQCLAQTNLIWSLFVLEFSLFFVVFLQPTERLFFCI